MFFKVFQKHVASVSSAFRRMLQLLYLDVSKADWVLHCISPFPPSAASLGVSSSQRRQGIHTTPWLSPSESDGGAAPFLSCVARGRPSGFYLYLKFGDFKYNSSLYKCGRTC
jgi:hypothetical protein